MLLLKKVAVKVYDKKLKQYEAIITAMSPDQEYAATYFCEVLNVKISQEKKIFKELVDMRKIKIVGTYRNRSYMLKNNNMK